jgi:hypothetical protein
MRRCWGRRELGASSAGIFSTGPAAAWQLPDALTWDAKPYNLDSLETCVPIDPV